VHISVEGWGHDRQRAAKIHMRIILREHVLLFACANDLSRSLGSAQGVGATTQLTFTVIELATVLPCSMMPCSSISVTRPVNRY